MTILDRVRAIPAPDRVRRTKSRGSPNTSEARLYTRCATTSGPPMSSPQQIMRTRKIPGQYLPLSGRLRTLWTEPITRDSPKQAQERTELTRALYLLQADAIVSRDERGSQVKIESNRGMNRGRLPRSGRAANRTPLPLGRGPTPKYLICLRGGPDCTSETEVPVLIASTDDREDQTQPIRRFKVGVGVREGFAHASIIDCRWPYTLEKSHLPQTAYRFTLPTTTWSG